MLTIFRVAFGVLLALKAADIGWRGHYVFGSPLALALALIWAAAALAVIRGWHTRVACGVIIVCSALVLWASQMQLYNQHLYLISSICVILMFDRSVVTLLKAQLTIAYTFAALSKINEAFLSGTVVYASAVNRPFWETFIGIEPAPWFLIGLSVASILTEAFLAFAFWLPRLRWVALVVGVGFHVIMLFLMTQNIASLLRLSIFGLLMIVLYIPFFPDQIEKLVARTRPKPQLETIGARYT